MSLTCPSCGTELSLSLAALGHKSVVEPAVEAQSPVEGVRASKRLKYQYNDQTFLEFWKVYPRRVGKAAAFSRWMAVVREIDPRLVIDAAQRYADYCSSRSLEERFIKYPEGWLSAGRWDDELTAPVSVTDPAYIVGTDEYATRIRAEEERAIREMA